VLVFFGFTPVFAAGDALVGWWNFDQGQAEAINGGGEYVEGIVGKVLKFDGFTTFLTQAASNAPAFDGSFTIEAWIAPQTYSWNQAAIVSQGGDIVSGQVNPDQVALMPGLFSTKYSSPDLSDADSTMSLRAVDLDWSRRPHDWSARWRGFIQAKHTGQVTFTAKVNHGIRLEIGGQMVIDG